MSDAEKYRLELIDISKRIEDFLEEVINILLNALF